MNASAKLGGSYSDIMDGIDDLKDEYNDNTEVLESIYNIEKALINKKEQEEIRNKIDQLTDKINEILDYIEVKSDTEAENGTVEETSLEENIIKEEDKEADEEVLKTETDETEFRVVSSKDYVLIFSSISFILASAAIIISIFA